MNKNISVVVLLAGSSVRMNGAINKAFIKLGTKPVINYSLDKFLSFDEVKQIILVYNPNDEELLQSVLASYDSPLIEAVIGSTTRHLSLQKALPLVKGDYLLVHDAARPFTSTEDIKRLIKALDKSDIVTLYHKSVDAVKWHGKAIPKEELNLVTTPQGFNKKAISYLIANPNPKATDELEALEESGLVVDYVEETHQNQKITYPWDIPSTYKIGHSMDFHPFVKGEYLTLGGVKIESEYALDGYSDADCLYHAVAESILGALNEGDLGDNYPDKDPKYKDIDSSFFLKDVKSRLIKAGYEIANIDCMIYLEKPKVSSFKKKMALNIAKNLQVDASLISVKATTFEKKGVIGTNEGIACEVVTLIRKVAL